MSENDPGERLAAATPATVPAIGLESISLVENPTSEDPEAIKEGKFYERGRLEAELRGIHQDLDERKKYAKSIFILICCWLAAMFIILLLQGFGAAPVFGHYAFRLTDAVVLAAIGSTTVNVLGIFIIVINYLFPKREK